MNEHYRLLPAVDTVVAELVGSGLSNPLATAFARQAIDALRQELGRDPAHPTTRQLLLDLAVNRVRDFADALSAPPLPGVINATGTILHTGLGRSPLSARARAAVSRVASGYCQLEYDLQKGVRGDRQSHVEPLLARLLGAPAALVVNNCAAAVVLTLQALAQGREVVISRGELVEIGGSFRIPEIMQAAGCQLVEVGSTNKTRLDDYERALTPRTALLMKVHKSNFTQAGFVSEVDTASLVQLGALHGLPVAVDQGSGCVVDLSPIGITCSRVTDEFASSAGVVSFSGDKLLGGPQAGILVGRQELIDRCRRHPLARAVRADKLTLAALAGTLQDYLLADPFVAIPALAMLAEPLAAVQARAERLLRLLGEQTGISLRSERSEVGSGAAPTQGPPTCVVAIASNSANELARALRRSQVVPRIEHDLVLLDLRTVACDEVDRLAHVLETCLGA